MSEVTVKITGKNLVLTIPFDKDGYESKSGLTMVHASTRGNQTTELMVDGVPLVVGLNAYTKRP